MKRSRNRKLETKGDLHYGKQFNYMAENTGNHRDKLH